jgi:hypothetical protein
MLIRTHYVIDMVTGLIMAHYMHQVAERMSYFIDVKLLRQNLTKPDMRERLNFKPCKNCGWSNKCATDYVVEEEKAQLKAMRKEQRGRSSRSNNE